MNRAWRYQTVASTFWRDLTVHNYSADGRTLALYFLTCPDRTTEGFYSLRLVNLLDDIGWTAARFREALTEIEGFASYDFDAQAVFVIKGLKYHPPRGIKSIKGAINVLQTTNDSPELFARFLGAADRYAPEFATAIRDHYGIAHLVAHRRATYGTNTNTSSNTQGE